MYTTTFYEHGKNVSFNFTR